MEYINWLFFFSFELQNKILNCIATLSFYFCYIKIANELESHMTKRMQLETSTKRKLKIQK
jgi:hypothetical protein